MNLDNNPANQFKIIIHKKQDTCFIENLALVFVFENKINIQKIPPVKDLKKSNKPTKKKDIESQYIKHSNEYDEENIKEII